MDDTNERIPSNKLPPVTKIINDNNYEVFTKTVILFVIAMIITALSYKLKNG